MEVEIRNSIQITLPLILQLAGLLFAVLADPYIEKRNRNIMLILEAVVLCLVIQNVAAYLLDVNGQMTYLRTVSGIVGYSIRPLIIVLFVYIIDDKHPKWPVWLLVGINTAVHLTALFSGICFSIDENNHFQRGSLGYTAHIVSGILLAYMLAAVIKRYRHEKYKVKWIPAVIAIIITASVIADLKVDYRPYAADFLTIAVVTSCVFFYIWLHLQFVREHEEELMAQQRIQIMMSQMQPHFLFNTLATIQGLCSENPQEASRVVGKFGKYLRNNLNSLEQDSRISFAKELEHTMNYAEIEMVRFPNIRIEADIQDKDFTLPALSVQPMVENAIRHGVRIRDEGIISISTRLAGDCHEIVISDNGTGFDADELRKQEGLHLGIRNVRERVASMCGGSLDIESEPGIGTTVVIRIPEGGRP